MTFRVQKTQRPYNSNQTWWKHDQIVFCRETDPDSFERLIAMAAAYGISRREALRQCIRYALENTPEMKESA